MFLVHFWGEWHSGITRYIQNRKVSGSNPLMRWVILWEPTLLRCSRWTSGPTWNNFVINIKWMRLPPCQWAKVNLTAAKWPIKKVWAIFTFCFVFATAVFDKQANIHCSINSISRPISSHDIHLIVQAIAMDRCQSDFRKLDNFFYRKQQVVVKTDQKIYSLLIYDFIYDFFLSKDFK